MTLEALVLPTDGLTLRGLRRACPGAPRVLALHGWLDNAASFVPLLPHLPDLDLVLLDLPGHGRSDHLPPGVSYTGASAIAQVLAAADALGWERFCLLGHSMGAGIASLTAAAAPERIQALLAIEGLGGLVGTDAQTVTRLRDALTAARALAAKPLRVFPDLDLPVRARMRLNELSAGNARLLVERGVVPTQGGYHWSSDPRLTLPTPIRLTEGQVRNLLSAVTCPAWVLFATPAQSYFPEPQRAARAALLPHARVEYMAGTHHLHMEQPAAVAALLTRFLSDHPIAV